METKPSLLTDEFIEKFASEVEDGLPFNYCCDLMEIPYPTFDNWMKQGSADFDVDKCSIQRKFFSSVKKAYARFIKTTKKKIYNGDLGWQGAAWWLERTNKQFVLRDEDGSSIEPVIVNAGMKKLNNESKRR